MTGLSRQAAIWLGAAAVIIGVGAFLSAHRHGNDLRAWEAYLVNLLFWIGLAQGGVVVSAALYLTQSKWGGAGLYRLAECGAGFLPLGFLLLWPMLAGRELIFPWIRHPIAAKSAYLNVPFLFGRDGAILLYLWLLSWLFIYYSRREDAIAWAEQYESIERPPHAVRRLAPTLIISFALGYGVIGIDLVMSLSPQWYSTMLPLYFAWGAFWSGIAMMGLLAANGWRPRRADIALERGGVLHDLGKLVFAGATFWTYLLFAMYIVVWYADIPREAFFVVRRVQAMPWAQTGWSSFVLIWAIPFVVLMGRKPKETPLIMGLVCLLGLVGMWLERYTLVAPSLSPRQIPWGWIEALITLGFGGLFCVALVPGLALVPIAAMPAHEEEGA